MRRRNRVLCTPLPPAAAFVVPADTAAIAVHHVTMGGQSRRGRPSAADGLEETRPAAAELRDRGAARPVSNKPTLGQKLGTDTAAAAAAGPPPPQCRWGLTRRGCPAGAHNTRAVAAAAEAILERPTSCPPPALQSAAAADPAQRTAGPRARARPTGARCQSREVGTTAQGHSQVTACPTSAHCSASYSESCLPQYSRPLTMAGRLTSTELLKFRLVLILLVTALKQLSFSRYPKIPETKRGQLLKGVASSIKHQQGQVRTSSKHFASFDHTRQIKTNFPGKSAFDFLQSPGLSPFSQDSIHRVTGYI